MTQNVNMVNRHKRIYEPAKKNAGTMYTPDLKAIKKKSEMRRRPLGSSLAAMVRGSDKDLCEILVLYFNGEVEGEGAEYFTALLMNQIGNPYPHWDNPSDAEAKQIQKDVKELRAHHRKFKEAVTWLCGPKHAAHGLPQKRLLKLHRAGKVEWGRYPDIDSHNEDFVEYFERHGLRDFKLRASLQEGELLLFPRLQHIVDIFCAFLINECAGKKPDDMPVKICLSCGKLFSVFKLKGKTRARKRHCSLNCQQAGWWTKEKRADDVYVKRLSEVAEYALTGKHGYAAANLRERLDRPRVKQRLEKIKNRWEREWPKIAERVAEIEQSAQSRVENGNK